VIGCVAGPNDWLTRRTRGTVAGLALGVGY